MQSYSVYQPTRRHFQTQPPAPRRPPRLVLCLFAIIVGIILLVVTAFFGWHFYQQTKLKQQQTALRQSLTDVIEAHPNTQFSLSLQNMHTGHMIHVGNSQPFVAASTAKVLTACAYYHLVETGKKSLATQLGAYSALYQIQQMINQSNNDSWNYLTDDIGLSNLQNYANSIHIPYQVDGNLLTSDAMAQTLRALYTGTLLNAEHTRQLLSYMQHTNEETLITPAIPSSMQLYHKYGLLDVNLHDAAIIVNDNQSWSLVIYTKSTTDSDDKERAKTIQQLTSSVVNYIQHVAVY